MSISLSRTDDEMIDIYNRYVDSIYRIALIMLKNVPEAEDATQTVFIKLMTSGPQFESEEHMKAWLIITARNTCKDLLKGWWRSRRIHSDCIAEQSESLNTYKNDIWDEIKNLDEKYKLPIYLYYYEGYETAEIAEILEINHATLRTRLRTARKKLRLVLEEDIKGE